MTSAPTSTRQRPYNTLSDRVSPKSSLCGSRPHIVRAPSPIQCRKGTQYNDPQRPQRANFLHRRSTGVPQQSVGKSPHHTAVVCDRWSGLLLLQIQKLEILLTGKQVTAACIFEEPQILINTSALKCTPLLNCHYTSTSSLQYQ